jgi:hypothetical protein
VERKIRSPWDAIKKGVLALSSILLQMTCLSNHATIGYLLNLDVYEQVLQEEERKKEEEAGRKKKLA